jgi:hypothetical protein
MATAARVSNPGEFVVMERRGFVNHELSWIG